MIVVTRGEVIFLLDVLTEQEETEEVGQAVELLSALLDREEVGLEDSTS